MCQYDLNPNWLDIVCKIATVVIAFFNIAFAIYIFRNKRKQDAVNVEAERRMGWLKTLILDFNLKHLYDFFDNLEEELKPLKAAGISDASKQAIYTRSQDHFSTLRRKFIDILLAVDKKLYDNILGLSDNLQTVLSSNIFDNGINLAHEPKYNELIIENLTRHKTEIIKLLFSYRG